MKKSISITISDMDNIDEVLNSVDKLLKTIMLHYIDTNRNKFVEFVVSLNGCFSEILKFFNIKSEDIDNG
jgi:hypothetical protein